MRIALLTPRFWPEVRRGTERHVHDLAAELLRVGHEPVVVTTGRRPGRDRIDGLCVLRLPRLPERPLLLEPFSSHLPLLGRALDRIGCEVVHAFHAGEAVTAARWARPRRVPLVYSHMGIPGEADLAGQRRRGRRTRRAFELADAVVALSAAAAQAAEVTHGRAVVVIHPGVDLDRFAMGDTRSTEPTVVCAAAGAPRKRIGMLLDAWRIVREQHPRAQLLLDERGGARDAPGVTPMNMDDTRKLARLNGAAWAAVLPSIAEGFGLVLVEALATGTPVVATAAGGMPEVVDRPSIGRLFEGGPGELAAAIVETFALAQDPATRRACRERAADFSITATAAAHAVLYERVLQSTSAR